MSINELILRIRQWGVLLSFSVLFGLSACTKPADPVPDPTTGITTPGKDPAVTTGDTTGRKLLGQGSFVNGVHTVKGTVKVYEQGGGRKLTFTDFSTEGGPDLRIYVAEDAALTNFIEVTKLTQTGSFSVDLPTSYNPSQHKSVLIWCKAFGVLFGSATLK
jgi:hypothetical protein